LIFLHGTKSANLGSFVYRQVHGEAIIRYGLWLNLILGAIESASGTEIRPRLADALIPLALAAQCWAPKSVFWLKNPSRKS
jgi:hypothetical protein